MQSIQEWEGIRPDRFNNKEKVHIRVKDTLQGFQGGELHSNGGRKHYENNFGKSYQWKPQIRVELNKPMEGNTNEFPVGKKLIDFNPTQKKERQQRLHLIEGKSGHLEDVPYGIRTNNYSITEQKQHNLEQMMSKKNRVGGIEEMRNHLPIKALGDKNFKHPDYSTNFFKDGGLIPGANISSKKVNLNQLQEKEMEKKLKEVQQKIPKGTKWSDKVKNDTRKEDSDAIAELDTWIETTLKEANPNYRDPDLFFENLEKQNEKPTGKDVKKGAKK